METIYCTIMIIRLYFHFNQINKNRYEFEILTIDFSLQKFEVALIPLMIDGFVSFDVLQTNLRLATKLCTDGG